MPINDNDFGGGLPNPASDAHGQAALLLVESLVHGLIERSILTTSDADAIVVRASEVQAEAAELADGAGEKMWKAHTLLLAISNSLKHDLPRPNGA